MRYIGFIHHENETAFGISFPDFPGCISAGDSLDDVVEKGREALAFHIENMQQDGEYIPPPSSLEQIKKHPDLADWRENATFIWIPVITDKGSPKRVNISLDSGLLESVDEEAKRRNMTRSAFLSSAARKELFAGS